MLKRMYICSADNPLCKEIGKLARGQGCSSHALLDGLHLLAAYLDAGQQPEVVLVASQGLQNHDIQLIISRLASSVKLIELPDHLFQRLAVVQTPTGIMARIQVPTQTDLAKYNIDSIVLDRVQDPVNVGGILRTAVAAGVSQVICSVGCASVWGSKALRAGMGAQFHLHMHVGVDLLSFLHDFEGISVATELSDSALDLFELDLLAPIAWVMGNEGSGIDMTLTSSVDRRVFIPMSGKIESLNVGAAAAICLFEQRRQRSCMTLS